MPTVEVYKRADGLYDWRLKGDNHEILCGSLQGYTEHAHAVRGFLASQQAMCEEKPYLSYLETPDDDVPGVEAPEVQIVSVDDVDDVANIMGPPDVPSS